MESEAKTLTPHRGRPRSTSAPWCTWRAALCRLVLLGAAAVRLPAAEGGRHRPNILFILSDDHAVTATSCYGANHITSLFKTPHLDRLASEGVRMDACFVTNSICSPCRATILTGTYSHVNGMRGFAPPFDGTQSNVAKILQRAGYQTAVIGKWHLFSDPTGFDHWDVLPGIGDYDNPHFIANGTESGVPFAQRKGRQIAGRTIPLTVDLCKDWLEQRDPSRPFFLICSLKAPHEPWKFGEKYRDLFQHTQIPAPPSFDDGDAGRSPGSKGLGFRVENFRTWMTGPRWATGPLALPDQSPQAVRMAVYEKYVKDYLRCVAEVDDEVGRLLAYLDDARLTEDTVVFYTSDQGILLGEHGLADKRWMFEESIKVPSLVRWPREIPAGSVNRDLVANIDFAPTFLDYAGIDVPPEMQGRSFRPNLRGATPPDWRTAIYYHYWLQDQVRTDNPNDHIEPYPAQYGVRTQRYKLIFYYGLPLDLSQAPQTPAGWELYDLQQDPHERRNVGDDPAYAGVVANLKRQLIELKQHFGDRDEAYPELLELRRRTGGI